MSTVSGRKFWKRLLVDVLIFSMLFTTTMPSAMNAAGTVYAAEQQIPQEDLQEVEYGTLQIPAEDTAEDDEPAADADADKAAESGAEENAGEAADAAADGAENAEEDPAGDIADETSEETAEENAEENADDAPKAPETGADETAEKSAEDTAEEDGEKTAENVKVGTPSDAAAEDEEEGTWEAVSFAFADGSYHLDAEEAEEDSLPEELILELEKATEESVKTRTVRIPLDLTDGAAAVYDLYMVTTDPETFEPVYTELAWEAGDALDDVISQAKEDYRKELEDAGEEEEELPSPEFYLIPDLAKISLTEEQETWIWEFFAVQGMDSAAEWFLKGPSLRLMGAGLTGSGNGTVDIPVNEYTGSTDAYEFNGHILTIKKAGSYHLYNSHMGTQTLTTLSVNFADTVKDKITLNLDNISFGAVEGHAAIDFVNVSEAELEYTDNVTVNGEAGYAAVNVPSGVTLTVAATGSASTLNITVPNEDEILAVGFGTVSDAPGTVTFDSGTVSISSAGGSVVLGALDGSDALAVTISGSATFPSVFSASGGSMSKHPLKNVSITIGSYSDFEIYEKTKPEIADTNVTISGKVLRGKLQSKTTQLTTIEIKNGSTVARTLAIPNGYFGFMVSLEEGNYTLIGKGSGDVELRYKGTPTGGSVTTKFIVSDSLACYTDIISIFSPVFRMDSYDSLTENGTVRLYGEVDTNYGKDSGKTYTGDQTINEMGFALYEVVDGVESATPVYYKALSDNITHPEGTLAPSHGGLYGKYFIELTGLTPGTTYHARPYVTTAAETHLVGETYYLNDADLSGTETVLEFTTPKVVYPTKLQMTYGTTVDKALDRAVFDGTFTGKTTVQDGVTVTFPSDATAPFGSNIPGRYHLYSRTGAEGAYNYVEEDTKNLSATTGKTYYLKFRPTSGAESYNLPYKEVTVVVDKKELSVTDVGCKKKTYDASTDAISIIETITLDGVVSGDETKVTATPSTAVFNSKDVNKANTITLKGVSISGESASNYKLKSTTATIKDAEITKKPITLKPKAMTKQAGETFEPLEMEAVDGTGTVGSEKINGGVVPEFDSSYKAYKDNPDASYFSNVPGPDADIGVTGDGSWYTVNLKEELLNQNSVNYQITVDSAGTQFRFNADKPEIDKNYTIPQTATNGWYKETVEITPKASGLPKGFYEKGYDQVQKRDGPSETESTYKPESTLKVTKTASALYFRLRNSSTGAYTYVNQEPLVIKIDTGVPTAEVTSYTKSSDTSKIAGILSNILGNYYNETVTVNISFKEEDVPDGSSGLDVFKYTLDGKTWETGKLTQTNEGATMMEATGSFEIKLKQNGNVSFKIYDIAGNEKTYKVMMDAAGTNLWIIESVVPTIENVKIYKKGDTKTELKPAYETGEGDDKVVWYKEKADIWTTAKDTAGTGEKEGEAASGLKSIQYKKNDGSYESGWENDPKAETSTFEKTVKLITLDTDSGASGTGDTIVVKAEDNAGNVSEEKCIKNIKIDATNPVLSGLSQSPAGGTPTNGDVTISFTASDAASGLKSITWAYCTTEDGAYGSENTITVTADSNAYSFTPAGEANQNGWYRITVTDQVGHETVEKIHVENIDRLKPVISAFEVTAPEKDADWFHAAVTLTATASDAEKSGEQTDAASGISTYTYTVTKDGEAQKPVTKNWTEHALSMPIELEETGIYSVSVYVTDAAGNKSSESTISDIKIDRNVPKINVTASKNAGETWTKSNVTFKLENTAAGQPSGVTYYVKEGDTETEVSKYAAAHSKTASWDAETSTLTFKDDTKADLRFVLKAGNGLSSTSDGFKVRLTKTAPAAPGFSSDPEYKDGWYNAETAPVITFTASAQRENKAGVTTKLTWKENSGTQQSADIESGTKVFEFTENPASGRVGLSDGTWTFTYQAVDEAGNKSDDPAKEVVYKVDTAAPTTKTVTYEYFNNEENEWVSWLHEFTGDVFFNKKIRVTVPVLDATSGVEKIEFSTNGGSNWEKGSVSGSNGTFVLPIDTDGVVKFRVSDKADNTSTPVNLGVEDGKIWLLEDDAPIIHDFVITSKNSGKEPGKSGGWYTEAITVSALVTDDRTAKADEPDLGEHYSGLEEIRYTIGTEKTPVTCTGKTGQYTVSGDITDDGTDLLLKVEAWDKATNAATPSEAHIKVDINAPVIGTITREDPPGTEDTKGSFDLSVDVTDAASKVKSVKVQTYRKDKLIETEEFVKNGKAVSEKVSEIDGGFTITFTAEYNGTYKVVAEDNVGHTSDSTEVVDNIDKQAPTGLSIGVKTMEPAFDPDDWYGAEVTLELAASDVADAEGKSKASGLSKYTVQYSEHGKNDWNDGPSLETTAGTVDTLKANQSGDNDYRLKVEDQVGNIAYSSDTVNVKLIIGNPPLTIWAQDSVNGTKWTETAGGWINGTVSIRMYTTLISSVSPYTILVNKDDEKTGDKKEYKDPSSYGEWSSTQELVNGTERTVYTLKISEEGEHKYHFKITNSWTGYITESPQYTVRIDNAAPAAPTYKVNSADNTDTWYNGDKKPVITLIQAENTEGEGNKKAPLTSWYKLYATGDGTYEEFPVDNKVTVPDDGIWTLQLMTKDASLVATPDTYNKTETAAYTIKVDTVKPGINSSEIKFETKEANRVLRFLTFGNFGNAAVKVTVPVTDETSMPKALTYKITNVKSEEKTGTAKEEGTGTTTKNFVFEIPMDAKDSMVTITAEDVAGNKAEGTIKSDKSGKWTIETEGPSVELALEGKKYGDWYNYASNVTVKATASDASGLNSVEYIRIEGDKETAKEELTESEKAELTAEKTFAESFARDGSEDGDEVKFKVKAKDNAGNETTTEIKTFKLDTKAPVIGDAAGNPTKWVSSEQTISFTWSDKTSGIDDTSLKIEQTIDGKTTDVTEKEELKLKKTAEGFSFTTMGNGTYKATVKDKAGNESSKTVEVTKIDTKEPGEAEIKVTAGGVAVKTKDYVTKDPIVKVAVPAKTTVSDTKTTITIYRENEQIAQETVTNEEKVIDLSEKIGKTIKADGLWKITAEAENQAGTKTSSEFEFTLDRFAPVTPAVHSFIKGNTETAAVANRLSFGLFFKEEVVVCFVPKDAGEADGEKYTGVSEMYYLLTDKEETYAEKDLTATARKDGYKIKLPLEKKQYLYYCIVDTAGNKTAVKEFADKDVKLLLADTNAPKITPITVTGSEDSETALKPNDDGWYNTSVWLKATASDAPSTTGKDASGLNEVVWTENGTATKLLSNPTAITTSEVINREVSTEGTTTVVLTAKDNALNEDSSTAAEKSISAEVNIDTKAPTVKQVSTDKYLTDPSNKSKTVEMSVSDATSKAVKNGTDKEGKAYEYVIVRRVEDENGDKITDPAKQKVEPTFDEEGTESPLTGKRYAETYNFHWTADKNGKYTVQAMDLAGNATETVTVEVKGIDTSYITTAVVTVNGKTPDQTNWYAKRGDDLVFLITNQEHGKKTKVYWAFGTSAESTGKPAEDKYADIEDGDDGKGTKNPSITADGIHYLWVRTLRNTGAAAIDECYTIHVDTTKPTIGEETVTNNDKTDGKKTWTNLDQTVSFPVENTSEKGANGKSDIASVTVKLGEKAYKVTDGAASGDTTPWTFTADVNGTYTVTVKDKAGNTQTRNIVINHIDKTSPDTPDYEITDVTEGDPAKTWTTTRPSIEITKVNTGDGTAPVTTHYSFIPEGNTEKLEGTVTSAEQTIKLTADGKWTWTIWSSDEAGNESVKATGEFYVDTTAPVMEGVKITTVNGGSLAELGRMLTFGNFFKEAVRVTVTVTDARKGISTSGNNQLQYTIGSGAEQSVDIKDGKAYFDIPLATSASRVKMTVTDLCGNKSDPKYLKKNSSADDADLGSEVEAGLWTVDATKPEISETSFGISNGAEPQHGFYNQDVTFSVSVTDEQSGINNVTWTCQTNDGAEIEGTQKSYGNLKQITNTVDDVEQTVSAEGVTVVDFRAENNAGVKATLSDLSGLKEKSARTVKIDKTKPVIAYVSGNPDQWTAEEQTISFTVTDKAADGATVHAGVDDTAVKVKRLANGSLPQQDIDVKVLSESGDEHSYSFVTEGNAVYEITGSDLAGNAAEKLEVTVEHIDKSVPGAPKNNEGSVNGSASYKVKDYYITEPAITVKSSVNYVINSREKNTAPVTTCYQIYREGDADPVTYEVKSKEPETGTAPTAADENAGSHISKDKEKDGRWILKVWNKTASGKTSDVTETSFFIDRVAPSIEAYPEAVKVDDKSVYDLLNKLSFGIFYNRKLTVTVKVTDVSSFGKELYYTNPATGREDTAVIRLDPEDKTRGTADIVLPVISDGSSFTVSMRARDQAGNVTAEKDAVKLALKVNNNDVTAWVIEDTIPEADPEATVLLDESKEKQQTGEEEVDFLTAAYVRIRFSEYVKPAEGGRVRISVGSDFYYADLSTADIATGPLGTEAGITDPTAETYKDYWYVTIPISEFKKDGKALKLAPETSYQVTVLKDAFEDIARNLNKYVIVCSFATKEGSIPEPVIGGSFTLDIDPTEGNLSPEFDKDTFAYTMLLFDSMLDSTGAHLKRDLKLNMGLEGSVELGEVQLKDLEGNVLWTLTESEITREGGSVSFGVPGAKILRNESYYLSLEVTSYNKTSTYSFLVSTSAISGKQETTSGRSQVTTASIDLEELIRKLYPGLLEDAQNYWKVSLVFKARAVSAEAVPTEAEAAIAQAKNKTEAKSYDSLAAYPIEINIEKLLGRTGETKQVTDLGGETISVTFTVPASIRNKLVGIFREHDGVTDELQFTSNEDGSEVTVVTGKFSVYTLVYGVNDGSSGGGSGSGGSGGSGSSGGTINMGGYSAVYGGTWHNDGKLFVRADGTRPVSQFIRMDGKVYYLDGNGFASRPANYTVRSDYSVVGTVTEKVTDMKGTWINDGWRYTKMDGTDLKNGWAYLAYNGRFDWYYFNTSGWMLDGWFEDGKNTYYLHTTHDQTRGHMYTGWHYISGKWYYFRTKPEGIEGSLLRSGYAADGHYVQADGTWNGKGAVPVAGT